MLAWKRGAWVLRALRLTDVLAAGIEHAIDEAGCMPETGSGDPGIVVPVLVVRMPLLGE